MEQVPDFGAKPNKVEFTVEDHTIIKSLVRGPSYNAYKNAEHVLQFMLGVHTGFRSTKEVHALRWDQIQFGTHGPNALPHLRGLQYATIVQQLSKTNKLALGK